MDIQAYIESGIIESYVLGLASAEETAQIEEMRLRNNEVEQAIQAFSFSLEQHALENAVAPPAHLKDKLLNALKTEDDQNKDADLLKNTKESTQESSVISMHRWRMAAAASVVLLVVSAALNFHFYNQYKDKKEAYQSLFSQTQTLQANNIIYQTKINEWKSAAEMMADPVMAMVKMHSVKDKKASATVFWNTKNKDVYVMADKLPQTASGKRYQLWAMVNGKPVDAGMIDPSCSTVCKMKNIPEAQAFAITLEKEGGSSSPNLSQLLVMGNI